MNHPKMYRDDDAGLPELRALCLAFPGAVEVEMFGRPTFRTKKIFAVYGGGEKGEGPSRPHSVLFLPDEAEIRLLLTDPRFFVPAYFGPFGWVGVDFDAAPIDWNEVRSLVEDSYRNTAPKKLTAELDARLRGEGATSSARAPRRSR